MSLYKLDELICQWMETCQKLLRYKLLMIHVAEENKRLYMYYSV